MEQQLVSEGVVVSISEENKPIYKEHPTLNQIIKRIEKYHNPFHTQIETYKKEEKIQFIIDGHSLWSTPPAIYEENFTRADINIGNRDYSSCTRVITHRIVEFFKSKGLSVAINKPYEGKYLLAAHCSRMGVNGVQVEFNRKLYMNEHTLERNTEAITLYNSYIEELAKIIYQEFLTSTS
jgi:N-formylglutamate amidohydrolase